MITLAMARFVVERNSLAVISPDTIKGTHDSAIASGPGRCKINNGGCWQETRDRHTSSACLDLEGSKCQCPSGFRDIDECKEKKACQCPECNCKDTWGSYESTCGGDLLYVRDHDTCISKRASEAKTAWAAVWVILIGLANFWWSISFVHGLRDQSYNGTVNAYGQPSGGPKSYE
ncbi:hypothetical protein HHK36_002733 [Tetracentron sinense]|uniref:Uncharacterized protein n=1 Tax=Tetracentron sinense TaxID=13715 RepID=A0A834ZW69_TETSI|nr:hypothetical protein HHK36_002733 [Tetracentron sinense]